PPRRPLFPYTTLFRSLAFDRGAHLHDRTPAVALARRRQGGFTVETSRGAIAARDVLLATNGYSDGLVPSIRRRIIPIGSYIIATDRKSTRLNSSHQII